MNRFGLRLLGASFRQVRRRLGSERRKLNDLLAQLERQREEHHAKRLQLDNESDELTRRLEATEARIRQLRESAIARDAASAQPRPEAPRPEAARDSRDGASPERPVRFGELLVGSGAISRAQLETAIQTQKQFGGRLGDILIDLGFATREQLAPLLLAQAPKVRLGDLLVDSGTITGAQLDKALAFQRNSGGKLGDVLLSLRMIEPEQLYRVIATQNGLGRIGSELSLDTQVRLPETFARELGVVVIHQYVNRYLVAVNEPLDGESQARVEAALGMPIEQTLATQSEMERFWAELYGQEMLRESTSKLADEQPHNSARQTFTRGQLGFSGVLLLILAAGLVFDFWRTAIVANVLIQLFYFAMVVFKFWIVMLGSRRGAQIRYTPEDIAAIDERELPIYTILVPMYKEAHVLPKLIRNLERLDYPKAKLDVRLLIEEDDTETKAALERMNLPAYYTTIVVPDSLPKTKPKACNFGLVRARGEYVVIYDAEDQPDPDQLKKVYAAFRDSSDRFACVQAKLNYFNSTQNLLTRWFTHEYSMWFELLLPGIMRLDVPIPLGGTSNHFKISVLKELNAWDPYNVTEDADLGIRLYKAGYKTAIVDSRTLEEANSQFGNWIRQRSRWIKGYMQTWLVHMRNPFRLWKEIGFRGFLGFQVMVLATPALPLLNPIFWLMILFWYGWHARIVAQFFPGPLYYLASVELFLGNFFFVYSNIAGMYWVLHDLEKKQEDWLSHSIVKYALLTPLYWFMMSIASYKAAWQLIVKPFYWEKTTHGLDDGSADDRFNDGGPLDPPSHRAAI